MPVPLEYARSSLRLGPWVRRILLLLWAGLTVYLVYERCGLWARLEWRMWKSQRACRWLAEPAGRVVFEPDPAKGKLLVAARSGYREAMTEWRCFAVNGGEAVASTVASSRTTALEDARTDLEWFDDDYDLPPSQKTRGGLFSSEELEGDGETDRNATWPLDEFILMTHELRASQGPARLVVVRGHIFRGGAIGLTTDVHTIAIPFGRQLAVHVADLPELSDDSLFVMSTAVGGGVRLYAPQFDPSDASRFTCVYETDGVRGRLEGRLGTNDQVTFTVLDGPCTGRAILPPDAKEQDETDSEGLFSTALESDHAQD